MRYFRLHEEHNEKIVGVYPQSTECKIGDIQQSEIFQKIQNQEDFELPTPKLRNKAKPTSLLSVVAIPSNFLTVDSALVEFFTKFSTDPNKTWKIKVVHKSNILELYNLMYIPNSLGEEIIDFSKSSFYEGAFANWRYKGGEIEIKSLNQWKEIKENLKQERKVIKYNHLTINLSRIETDLIRVSCQYFLNGYIVSERLKTAMEEAGFTGIIFKDIEEYDNRISVTY